MNRALGQWKYLQVANAIKILGSVALTAVHVSSTLRNAKMLFIAHLSDEKCS